ncbi:hypothetical protein [Streptomyces litchfieldiae]|uniref:Uncharacterized protein n=1 Tax=Streptomyces litchfieldiae TaxID=3075543 RepID=A0ABU2MJ42_9ACTN|nr:hypothetical protein [Streptomyces sp. DSM 44938]MDT0341599.1 hypothetical protein [Streptomyces sp. DSM 44938]
MGADQVGTVVSALSRDRRDSTEMPCPNRAVPGPRAAPRLLAERAAR